jgi:hypothetical protein
MSRYRPPPPKSSKYITREGEARLRAELDDLWRVQRPAVTKSVAEAAAQGDRSENAEYIYGKKQLAAQMQAVTQLKTVTRLRVTHARPKSIDFIGEMQNVEELVLEYVSGFSDLSPLANLRRLKSLHTENLRRVSDFGGLAGVSSLRYLAIFGTTDWDQPIESFEFLCGLPALEVLRAWKIINRSPFPAMLPAVGLTSLKQLHIHRSYLPTNEYALMEALFGGSSGVVGADWGPHTVRAYSYVELPPNDIRSALSDAEIRERHPEVLIDYRGDRSIGNPDDLWIEFTGRGVRRVKVGSEMAERRCNEADTAYAAMKREAAALIAKHRQRSKLQR